MRITTASVLVDDQEKAPASMSEILGFQKKTDIPAGEHRWLTVVSPEQPDGVELLLEPDEHPAARPFKEALVADGIPYTSFGVADTREEYERLKAAGVRFTPGSLPTWGLSLRPFLMTPAATRFRSQACRQGDEVEGARLFGCLPSSQQGRVRALPSRARRRTGHRSSRAAN